LGHQKLSNHNILKEISMSTLHRTGKTVLAAAFLGLLALGANAMARGDDKEANWDKHHPRRAEVNARLANQSARIHREVNEGELSSGEAHQLHREDRQIRREERAMAAQNGGHITKSEQAVLNQQENQVSKQIGK
jgi:hypothetical protein